MSGFTNAETALMAAQLSHFKLDILRRLQSKETSLTPEGRARYEADVRLADSCVDKLLDHREVA